MDVLQKSLVGDNSDLSIALIGNLGLIVSAVSFLQWAPGMPRPERARAICNVVIQPYNLVRLFDASNT